jgi:hypothetical protein
MGASSMEDLAQAVVRQVLNPRSTHTYTGLWYSHEAEQSAAAAAWSPARIELAIKMISPSQADIVVFESTHPSLLKYPEANLRDSVGTSLFVATRRTWLLWLEGFRAGAAGPEWTVDLPPSLRILNAVIRQHALKVKTCWSETPHGPAWEAMALRQLCSES